MKNNIFYLIGFIFSVALCSSSSCNSSDFASPVLDDLQSEGYTIKEVPNSDDQEKFYVAYKVENSGEFFTEEFSSNLFFEYLKVEQGHTQTLKSEVISSGAIHSTIEVPNDPVASEYFTGYAFHYKVCSDGDDPCKNESITL